MVITRSNRDTGHGPDPLPFDPKEIIITDGIKARAKIATYYWNQLLSRWPEPHWLKVFSTKPEIEAGLETEWVPAKALGSGSRMTVCLWKELDDNGDAVDSLVIKDRQLRFAHGDVYSVGLAREAVIQGHLTAMKGSKDVITQLRGYKFVPAQTDYVDTDRARMYMRYAPHGTLDDVFNRYRATKTHLPELFLWSVLVDLAQSRCLLSECPSTWNPILRQDEIPPDFEQDPNNFILHQDMKGLNCFIGDGRVKGRSLSKYHPVELGDFGLAEPRKPRSGEKTFNTAGTLGWLAPEQLLFDRYWQRPIYNRVNNTVNPITETTNAWGVGQIMWHLITLRTPNEFPMPTNRRTGNTEPSTRNSATDRWDEQNFYAKDRHVMSWVELNKYAGAGLYSPALRHFIYECLRPEYTRRPDAAELLRQAKRGYNDYLADARQRKDGPHDFTVGPVQFTNGDMNDYIRAAGQGTANLTFSKDDPTDNHIWYNMICGRGICDPEDVPLEAREGWQKVQAYWEGRDVGRLDAKDALGELGQIKVDELKDPGHMVTSGGPVEGTIRKHVRSWEPEDEQHANMRALLKDLRHRTQEYTAAKPMALLTYVLSCEKYDVAASEKVLAWMYKDKSNIRFPWATKPANRKHATVVVHKWKAKWRGMRPARTHRECLYFVSNEIVGPLRVQAVLEKLDRVYKPEDGQPSAVEAPLATTHGSEGLTSAQIHLRVLEVQQGILIMYERGELLMAGWDEKQIYSALEVLDYNVEVLLREIRAQMKALARPPEARRSAAARAARRASSLHSRDRGQPRPADPPVSHDTAAQAAWATSMVDKPWEVEADRARYDAHMNDVPIGQRPSSPTGTMGDVNDRAFGRPGRFERGIRRPALDIYTPGALSQGDGLYAWESDHWQAIIKNNRRKMHSIKKNINAEQLEEWASSKKPGSGWREAHRVREAMLVKVRDDAADAFRAGRSGREDEDEDEDERLEDAEEEVEVEDQEDQEEPRDLQPESAEDKLSKKRRKAEEKLNRIAEQLRLAEEKAAGRKKG